MGEFQYTARSARGETVTGSMNADSEAAVLRVLDEKELFPVGIKNLAGAGEDKQRRLTGRIPSRDVGVMYSQLADLIGSGVPLFGR
jgi:type IV pilus assembly protein PilC